MTKDADILSFKTGHVENCFFKIHSSFKKLIEVYDFFIPFIYCNTSHNQDSRSSQVFYICRFQNVLEAFTFCSSAVKSRIYTK